MRLAAAEVGGANVGIARRQHGQRSNRHWLIRAKNNVKGRRIKRLGPRDELVEMKVSAQAWAQDPSLPKAWVVRVIHDQIKGFRPQRLITSLLDAVAYSPGAIPRHLRQQSSLFLLRHDASHAAIRVR